MRPVKFLKVVNTLQLFDIQIFGLKHKSYSFRFEVDTAFFEAFPDHNLFEKGNCTVNLELEKTERLLTLDFAIEGTLELTCDRSLEKFNFPFEVQEQLFYQYTTEVDKESDDEAIIYILPTAESINIAQPIYELINLQVPMRKIHPKYAEDEDFFYSTAETDESESENSEEITDSLQDKLQNLKNRFNK